MQKTVLFALMVGAAAGAAQAQQEVGRVVSSTPVIQQVQVPRQVCTTQQVAVEQPSTGAGAAMGAIAGGALGNAIGDGSGRAVATMIGLMGGALLGNRVENPGTQVQNVQSCTTQTFYENRAVSYNVVYEFGGKQYQVNLPNDPGPTVQLQITPVAAPPVQSAPPLSSMPAPIITTPAPMVTMPAPVVVAPAPVYMAATPTVVYPAYHLRPYYRPYYHPPVSLHFGYVRHSGRWR